MSIFSKLNDSWYKKSYLHLLSEAKDTYASNILPRFIKAIVVPHAALSYSGLCAASSYASTLDNDLNPNRNIKRVIILGTWHNCTIPEVCNKLIIPDISESSVKIHNGNINIDIDTYTNLLKNTNIIIDNDNTHFSKEHSIEIQMQFIQYCYPLSKVVPILVGKRDSYDDVVETISNLDNENTLWIMSGDFYHINGRFNFKMKNNEVKKNNANAVNLFLEPNVNTSKKMLTYYNNYYPTICGWNVFRLWSELPISHQLHGNINCYYTSIYNEINYPRVITDEYESSVSYISIIYYPKIIKLQNLFTNYDLLNIDIAINELINEIQKNNIPENQVIDYYEHNSPKFINFFMKKILFKSFNFSSYKNNNLLIEQKLKEKIGVQPVISKTLLSLIAFGIGTFIFI